MKRSLPIINRFLPAARNKPTLMVVGFFAKALIYYIAFLFLWMLLGEAYANTYRTVGTTVFRSFPPHGKVLITPKERPTRLLDSTLVLGNVETLGVLKQDFSARYHGYAPARLILSLILASPIPWNRKVWALLWGIALIHFWIIFELSLMILDAYTGDHGAAMFTYNPTLMKNVKWIFHVAVETIVPRYVIPSLLWILVTFRRGDWEDLQRSSLVCDE